MKLVLDLLSYIARIISDIVYFLFDWFLDLTLMNKLIIVNGITAFFAVVLPSAEYYIFGDWSIANNPLNVHMIGIVCFMFVTIFFYGYWVIISRVVINLFFIGWVVYYQFINPFVKCDHTITTGYYLNYAASIMYILLSLGAFLNSKE